jgi:hypothetical protein
MDAPSGLVFLVGVVISALVWVSLLLRKVRRYENKEFLNEVYENAEADIGGKSLDDLVKDSKGRRLKRDSKTR